MLFSAQLNVFLYDKRTELEKTSSTYTHNIQFQKSNKKEN